MTGLLPYPYIIFVIFALAKICSAGDITPQAFGNVKDGIIAAFGDFNSDELTDVFVLRNDFKTLEILFGSDSEPILRSGPKCELKEHQITSVIPGDFDGDALMDVMVTLKTKKHDVVKVIVHWGGPDLGSEVLNCSSEFDDVLLKTDGEPMAIDYNRDMIIDLFGIDEASGNRAFWIFNKSRVPQIIHQAEPTSGNPVLLAKLVKPHSNAFIDLNHDYNADLFLQTEKGYEVWYGKNDDTTDFRYSHQIDLDIIGTNGNVGQAVFMDMELVGEQNLIVPICFTKDCSNSTFVVYDDKGRKTFRDIHVNFKDQLGVSWGFIEPQEDDIYLKTITVRTGDFNMDGYPDLIATLKAGNNPKRIQTFLLENVPCKVCIKPFKRTFEVKWNALSPMGNNTVAGAFYDFYQDGVLDVILIEKNGNNYRPLAFRNTLDYDANFVKVIVLTGLVNSKNPTAITPLGRKKRTYGTNLPGPRIDYFTTTQEGDIQRGSSAQLPQSAYFALQLPYTIFGLGRAPNFVDSLTVGLYARSHNWTQLIPNSQIIVVPNPINDAQRWRAQLFVTPSKLILMSVIALGGTCLFIMGIILVLYIKEKREDKQEKLQEAHRFHFDAM